jgi:hypothetical protein
MIWKVEVLTVNQKVIIEITASSEAEAKIIANDLGYKVLSIENGRA